MTPREAGEKLLQDIDRWDCNAGEALELITNGADLSVRDANGETVLHKAVYWGHMDIALLLIACGAETEAEDRSGNTPLIIAAGWGRKGAVRRLLEAGANPSHRNRDGKSAHDIAVEQNQRESISLLNLHAATRAFREGLAAPLPVLPPLTPKKRRLPGPG